MIFANEKIVRALFEQLPVIQLKNPTDKNYRDLYLEQLGEAINLGGRTIVISYLFILGLLPKVTRTVPTHVIRLPMAALLLFQGESIFFYGAKIAVRRQAAKIVEEMKNLPEGPLSRFANSII
jgi:hypothetical protein